jgi:hypothetical protein
MLKSEEAKKMQKQVVDMLMGQYVDRLLAGGDETNELITILTDFRKSRDYSVNHLNAFLKEVSELDMSPFWSNAFYQNATMESVRNDAEDDL